MISMATPPIPLNLARKGDGSKKQKKPVFSIKNHGLITGGRLRLGRGAMSAIKFWEAKLHALMAGATLMPATSLTSDSLTSFPWARGSRTTQTREEQYCPT